MYFIVGLGNPGLQYENTRHNVGFLTIDYLAEKHNINVKKLKHKALYGQGEISDQKVMLIKPQTYMNNSGESVRDFKNFYKFDDDKLIVILDDIDIDFGKIRIKKKGSAGTHNGMKSIIYQTQTDKFPRIKISVGQKPEYMDLANFVLSGFNGKDVDIVREEIIMAADAIEMMLETNIDKAMNKYNSIDLLENNDK
ncbi:MULTISPECIES: aminoacyl-tRNA hydrolase [Anaerococcus]|jgi:aminoacyl-tRNA hydrolase|uniref:Peptidyl-tRNA hydrolase n=1 Tax=Anaerococcus octavius TaxID=54007 RepID=A0A2I1MA24_9FIRM|nr:MULTISPECIES: aminoacyl-tRNA hydrolase [Anaerococcus]MBS6105673.1 aminoacyl-tRNA hydrolase [Anaerococcus sp.]MDU2599187.1 aminoacyl-tRNA hydrolase [Anaerococcus sp.]MDU3176356.1 aminoacyl-tRNA hydrolase [Anaerococcus sp.]MDU4025341.1 aminoacyl-tRNA hydrolase [Anaerococcus sp.]MDU7411091.1 aminoacyl-tRNA hydrolase [Anaerococcus sp.]